jgi:hypothetical protein
MDKYCFGIDILEFFFMIVEIYVGTKRLSEI